MEPVSVDLEPTVEDDDSKLEVVVRKPKAVT
jgi:hypothetical protein